MTDRVAMSPEPLQPPLVKQHVLLDLPSFLEMRRSTFPPHVIESLRTQFPDMAAGLEALMNTAEMTVFLANMPCSVVRDHDVPVGHPFSIRVHTPETVYVGPEFYFIMCQVLNLDKAWKALKVATDNFTKLPDEPVNMAKAYGLE